MTDPDYYKLNFGQMFFLSITLGILIIAKKIMTSSPEKFITNLVEQNTNIKLDTRNKRTSEQRKNKDIIVNNKEMFVKIASTGELGLAESYIDGDWDSEDLEKTIYKLSSKSGILETQIKKQSLNFIFMEIKAMIKNRIANNTIQNSKRNVDFHYNAGNDLFEKMLGKHMQYTCAYFYKSNMTLDEAQYAKMELIAKKLDLKPNMRILDIGCGFGSMAHHLAKHYDVNVIGVTLSKEQKSYAEKHFSNSKVTIEFKDYRQVTGLFDRVYSVGMFEHVGIMNYQTYFDKCFELLKPQGIMLIHTIGHNGINNWKKSAFFDKYIFPEGELPNMINLSKSSTKWILQDFQNIGKSYTKTLRSWKENIGNWKGLDEYDYCFRRMWHFYLCAAAASFSQPDRMQLFQLVYTKKMDNTNNLYQIRK